MRRPTYKTGVARTWPCETCGRPAVRWQETPDGDVAPVCDWEECATALLESYARAAALEMFRTLREVADFWRGGDAPPDLMARIEAVIARVEGGR